MNIDKDIDGIRYLNTGDWVTSLTAIIEYEDGTLELVRFDEFMKRTVDRFKIAGDAGATAGG